MLKANRIYHTLINKSGSTQFLDISLQIKRGEIVCFLGKSGVGKSTLLKILTGLIIPDKGEVTLDGKLLVQPLAPVALVFQDYQNAVFQWLTVRDNLNLGKHKSVNNDSGHFNLEEIEKELSLNGLLNEYPRKLSGGQIQRVQIGRALISDVEYLMLDEPDSSVDLEFKHDLQHILIDLATKRNNGIALVTHGIDYAVYIAHRIYILKRKKLTPCDVEISEEQGYNHKLNFVDATQDPEYSKIYKCVYKQLFE